MTLDAEPLAKPTPSRRSWRRFSLRSFLVFMMLVGCFFGWVGKERRQSEFERKIGKKLEERGASVGYGGPYDSQELRENNIPQGWWRDLTCKVLGERIWGLNISLPMRDGNLTPLAGLKNVEFLFLVGESITDLTPLAELEKLEELYLDDVSASDLTPLAKLKNLKSLSLHGSSITDEQINSLKKALPNCKITP